MPRRVLPPLRFDPDITGIASVLADPSRIAMLDVLLDAAAHPIGELARRVGVTAATASSHLRRLEDARLVVVHRSGRERRVTLASHDVAELLERMAVLAASDHARSPNMPHITRLRFARTCYDHLAGVVGVAVATALVERGWLHRTTDNFEPAPELLTWLAAHGHPVPIAGRRPLTRACLDWSERVPHVAGRIGAALADLFLARGWVRRMRDTRALRLTDTGRRAIERELSIVFPTSASTAAGSRSAHVR